MNSNVRACIAYVAGRLISKKRGSSLFDHSATRQLLIGGAVEENRVDVFDYDANRWLMGSGDGQRYKLTYGFSEKLRLELEGAESFRGYDYMAACHFEGRVKEGTVTICDGTTSRWFSYTL